ncbi:MAG: hypothetical protein RI894_2270 [Bacteroidota bacterium]
MIDSKKQAANGHNNGANCVSLRQINYHIASGQTYIHA